MPLKETSEVCPPIEIHPEDFSGCELGPRGTHYTFRLMTFIFGNSPGYLLGFQVPKLPKRRTSKPCRRRNSEMVARLK